MNERPAGPGVWAGVIRGDEAVVRAAIECGGTGIGCVHAAAHAGRSEVLTLVISNDGDPNERNALGETAVFIAVRLGRIDLVEVLLARGADPNLRSHSGTRVLEIAMPGSSMFNRLIEAGAVPSFLRVI